MQEFVGKISLDKWRGWTDNPRRHGGQLPCRHKLGVGDTWYLFKKICSKILSRSTLNSCSSCCESNSCPVHPQTVQQTGWVSREKVCAGLTPVFEATVWRGFLSSAPLVPGNELGFLTASVILCLKCCYVPRWIHYIHTEPKVLLKYILKR